jgi:phage terminase large subunit
MTIELPSILNIPEKLLPLITRLNDFRYFLIDGGRASSKTQTVARIITYLSEQQPLRIVCGREIQKSIDESVYTIFSDLIRDYNLNFEVMSAEINHKATGSTIHFRGFREQGSTNIKGLEGVDVLWVDESQAITKKTLDVIIPTIRKQNAKIFWTMNREVENDPVFDFFINRPDCLHIHIDYTENKFCPVDMIKEADLCKARDMNDYNHIWLGHPLVMGDDALFNHDSIYNSPKLEVMHEGSHFRILAVDVARFGEDETVFTIIESRNIYVWEQIHQEAWRNKSLMETVGKVIDIHKNFCVDMVVIDDTGVGGGVTDRLNELTIKVEAFNGGEKSTKESLANRRTEAYYKLKDMFEANYLKILANDALMKQLLSIKYKYKSSGQKIIVSKDDMRKEGIKSPDKADALMMACFYTDKILDKTYRGESSMLRYGITENETVGSGMPSYGITE